MDLSRRRAIDNMLCSFEDCTATLYTRGESSLKLLMTNIPAYNTLPVIPNVRPMDKNSYLTLKQISVPSYPNEPRTPLHFSFHWTEYLNASALIARDRVLFWNDLRFRLIEPHSWHLGKSPKISLFPPPSPKTTTQSHIHINSSPNLPIRMVQYIITPWSSPTQLLQTRAHLYPPPPQSSSEKRKQIEEMRTATQLVGVWVQRGNCPHLVESTAILRSAWLNDVGGRGEGYCVRAAYAGAFSR